MAKRAEAPTQAWKKADMDESAEAMGEVRKGLPFLKILSNEDDADKFRRNYVRVLPPRADYWRSTFYHTVALHYINQRAVPCTDFHEGKFCRLCALAQKLRRDGKEQASYEMRAKYYALMNAVKVGRDGSVAPDAKVEILSISWNTFTDLQGEIDELPKAERDITDPEYGRMLVIKRKGKTAKNTKYQVEFGEQGEFNEGNFDLLNGMYDLTEVYPAVTDDVIDKLLEGGGSNGRALPAAVWDDDDDDEPIAGQFRELAAPAEDDDDDDDEEEEKPPVTKPKTRAKTTAKTEDAEAARDRLRQLRTHAAVVEADDDDDDEEDDDDE